MSARMRERAGGWRACVCVGFVMLAAGCEPDPTLQATRKVKAEVQQLAIREAAPRLRGPLTLDEAVRYAIDHNLEAQLAAQENAIREEMRTGARLRGLPNLVASGELSETDRERASASRSYETGEQSLEPSISSERQRKTWDVTQTWNLLDFGISYYRARQASFEAAAAAQRLRRVRQNLVLEVTRAYWQAQAAKVANDMAGGILSGVRTDRSRLQDQIERQAVSKLDGLEKKTALIEMEARLRSYEREARASRAELGRLIGLPAGAELTLAEVDFTRPPAPLSVDLARFETALLENRPELYEQDLSGRISRAEARAALLGMLPSPASFVGFSYDHDQYLVNQQWWDAGMRVSWNLFAVPQKLSDRRAARLQGGLAEKRGLALAAAMLAQLHISVLQYQEAKDQLGLQRDLFESRDALLAAMRDGLREGKMSEREVLEESTRHIAAQFQYLNAYAETATGAARILNTIGLDPVSGASALRPAPASESMAGAKPVAAVQRVLRPAEGQVAAAGLAASGPSEGGVIHVQTGRVDFAPYSGGRDRP